MWSIFKSSQDAGFRITFGGDVMTDWEIREQLLKDARWVGISLLVAVLMLAVSTRSAGLTFFCILQLAVSFPLSYALYYTAGYENLTVIQFLAPFVILGIGLDDMFVFVGIYRSLRHYSKLYTMEQRFSVAWTRASGAMLATSATSAAAFAANVVSPVPAVRLHCTMCCCVATLVTSAHVSFTHLAQVSVSCPAGSVM
jgi:protein dispatched 3